MSRLAKRSAFIAAGVVALMGAGIAFAAWTTSGSGTGTATAGTAANLQVTVTNVTGLYPTGTFNVPFTVTNPNAFGVQLSQVALTKVTDDQSANGCDPTVLSAPTLTDTDIIAAGATSATRNLALSMSNAATDACQGATFTLTLTASGQSH